MFEWKFQKVQRFMHSKLTEQEYPYMGTEGFKIIIM